MTDLRGPLDLRSSAAASIAAPKAECSVRAATLLDMAAVTAIYAHFVENTTATFDLIAPGEATMRRRFESATECGLPYLVAELDSYIVGYCYAGPFRPREGYRFTVEDSIYVRADCRGYGVGNALLTELIARCRVRGCHSMVACICGVNVPSTALHASLGFVPIGTLPEAGRKFGKWLSLSIMQRLLEPVAPPTDASCPSGK
ncbi:MAG: N-acetyltransferase family protein [Acidobacteriaceae bacterium]